MQNHHIEDTLALLDGGPARASRRHLLGALAGLGYCAAAGTVQAQTAIRTPADGLVTGRVMIDAPGRQIPVYRSMPVGATRVPVVLVISEVFGVHEYIADVTRRLARQGYLAVAPDLFVRQGDPMSFTEPARLMSELIAKVPDGQVMGDLDATLQWALGQGGDAARVGLTGFCWGGRNVWLYAAREPRVRAAVAWYGRLVGPSTELTPTHPLQVAAQLHAPVLGLYGGADAGIPVATVEQMRQALAAAPGAAARASELVVFPDTPHAFHADYRPSYRAGPAQEGWQRMLDWFRRHGVI